MKTLLLCTVMLAGLPACGDDSMAVDAGATDATAQDGTAGDSATPDAGPLSCETLVDRAIECSLIEASRRDESISDCGTVYRDAERQAFGSCLVTNECSSAAGCGLRFNQCRDIADAEIGCALLAAAERDARFVECYNTDPAEVNALERCVSDSAASCPAMATCSDEGDCSYLIERGLACNLFVGDEVVSFRIMCAESLSEAERAVLVTCVETAGDDCSGVAACGG